MVHMRTTLRYIPEDGNFQFIFYLLIIRNITLQLEIYLNLVSWFSAEMNNFTLL
jgi:hypothetical protein